MHTGVFASIDSPVGILFGRGAIPVTLANAASSTRRGARVLDTSFVKNVHGSDALASNPNKMSLVTREK